MIQLVHEEDVVHALTLGLAPGIKGVFNIVGPGEAPLSKILKVLEKKTFSIPGIVAWPMLERLFRLKMTSFPTPEIRHIQYNCIVDGSLARRILGFEPRYDLVETIQSVNGYDGI